MQDTHVRRIVTGPRLPASRDRSATKTGCPPVRSQEVWTALVRARAQYAPRVMAAAEDAVFTCYQPSARGFAIKAGLALGLGNQQAEELADRGLAKAIRDCQAWDIHGFELYVEAAIESELRNNGRSAAQPVTLTPRCSPLSPRL